MSHSNDFLDDFHTGSRVGSALIGYYRILVIMRILGWRQSAT
jgi:hypothetical protein